MRRVSPLILTLVMLANGACSYSEERLPDCWTENVPPSLDALKRLRSLGDSQTELHHTLCSTYGDRLANAEKALSASGFKHAREIAELGDCIRVRVRGNVTPATLKGQIEGLCTISAATRVDYWHWSGQIADQFVFVSGNYVSIDPIKGANVR